MGPGIYFVSLLCERRWRKAENDFLFPLQEIGLQMVKEKKVFSWAGVAFYLWRFFGGRQIFCSAQNTVTPSAIVALNFSSIGWFHWRITKHVSDVNKSYGFHAARLSCIGIIWVQSTIYSSLNIYLNKRQWDRTLLIPLNMIWYGVWHGMV